MILKKILLWCLSLLALLAIASWLLIIGIESGVVWSMLWLPLRDVPLDTKPHDQLSATRLALTVARAADCGGFEPDGVVYQDYAAFYCATDVSNKKKSTSYEIYIYFNETAKIKDINKFKPGGELTKPTYSKKGRRFEIIAPMIKAGPYFVVYGNSSDKHSAKDFPGETINLEQFDKPDPAQPSKPN